MMNYKGMMLPDGEKHLTAWMDQDGRLRDGLPTYQLHKYEAALRHTARRRAAVDVGAHVGLWSRVMALDFKEVWAFEPTPAHIECWKENMRRHPNALLVEAALGDHHGTVSLCRRHADSCGDTGVVRPGEAANAAVDAPLFMLDAYGLPELDLLKIDNEGYEYFVIKGGLETIKRCRPTVIVEQKPGMGQRYGLRERQAVEALQELGMVVAEEISGDFILTFQENM